MSERLKWAIEKKKKFPFSLFRYTNVPQISFLLFDHDK